jgi:hypothetical protein
MKIKLLAVFGLCVIGTWLIAQQQDPDDRVARLIRELDDNKFETRRQAQEELLKAGKPSVPQLKKALAGNPSLEVAVRLREIIRKLAIHDDAGPAAGDLQVRLFADKKAVKPGELVKFTVTLFNLSDEDLNVQTATAPAATTSSAARLSAVSMPAPTRKSRK